MSTVAFKCKATGCELTEYPGYRCPKCNQITEFEAVPCDPVSAVVEPVAVVELTPEQAAAVAGGTGSVSFI